MELDLTDILCPEDEVVIEDYYAVYCLLREKVVATFLRYESAKWYGENVLHGLYQIQEIELAMIKDRRKYFSMVPPKRLKQVGKLVGKNLTKAVEALRP